MTGWWGDGVATRLPVRDAAVEERPRVDAVRCEDARGHAGARAALADRDDGSPVRELVRVRAHEAVRDVAAAGDVALVGGVAQGIGYALYEKIVWQNGRMQNGQMTNYIMPTSADLPPIRVFFEEMGNIHGAFGAKGIGELPMDGPAPAIVNAIEDALGIPMDSIPLLPEDIFDAMASAARRESDTHFPAGVR